MYLSSSTVQGKFRALGNIGDVLMKMGDTEEAIKMYQKQLSVARQARDRGKWNAFT